jgi:hypothetical protein
MIIQKVKNTQTRMEKRKLNIVDKKKRNPNFLTQS